MVQPFEDFVSAELSVTLGDISLWVLLHFNIVVFMVLDLSCVLRIMMYCAVCTWRTLCSFSFTLV